MTIKKSLIFMLITLVIGFIIGNEFFNKPSVEEKIVEVNSEADTKMIAKLKAQIVSLETTNMKKKTIIVQRVDGSKKTTIDETSTTVKELTQKFENEINEYKKEIAELKDKHKIVRKSRRLAVGPGYGTDRKFYGRIAYDIFSFGTLGTNVKRDYIGADFTIPFNL